MECNTIYTVIIYEDFGTIEEIETFTSKLSAELYLLSWANNNNGESIFFSNVSEAVKWFKENEEKVGFKIELFQKGLK